MQESKICIGCSKRYCVKKRHFQKKKKKLSCVDPKTGPVIITDPLSFLRSLVSQYSARAFVGKELCSDPNLMNAFENAVTDIGKEMTPGFFRVIFPWWNKLYMK